MPIILPITNTQTRDCIIQDGARYCESAPITKSDVRSISFGFLGVFVWFVFSFWLGEKIGKWTRTFSLTWILGLAIGLPLLVVGIIASLT